MPLTLQRRAFFQTHKGHCSILNCCMFLSLNRLRFKETCNSPLPRRRGKALGLEASLLRLACGGSWPAGRMRGRNRDFRRDQMTAATVCARSCNPAADDGPTTT
ncbi:hypothetical protein CO676_06935 [Sinorhizobium sp. BJ1]|nr:hypothetical protein CO676_06935 [Sinorhizobium sp. BJ1]